ncbi:DUF4139 domain-containing protein [Roseicyclus marinus]|uniref:DUF4139 domain-containing protein n=1 Tax=Roseicyclus marinus TaxID=2161673 RepID=UPI0024104FF7|nr:DUF4139 domain-containing protein [Roseicyclus marinus]MDG3041358.1 DUF4139 domain-containing protein [Roseicyclus marinus]
MRFALSLTAALLCGTAALADDIVIRADIDAATVFLSGAEITRRGSVTIPAGTHRLLIAMPDAAEAERIGITGPEGLSLGVPQPFSGQLIAEGALDDAEQAAARAAVTEAETALQLAQDDLAAADAGLRALETQLSYLSALSRGGPEGAAMPADLAALPQLLATLGAETERVQTAILAAQIARRDLTGAVEDRQTELDRAINALAQLRPLGPGFEGVEVRVTAETETTADLMLQYLSFNAGWEPSYEFRLDSATGALEVARYVTLYTDGDAHWQDVDVTVSTAEPNRQRSPSEVYPTPARIMEPAPPIAMETSRIGGFALEMADAAPVIAAEPVATVAVEGLSLSYVLRDPVSIGPAGAAVLPLDTLTLATETEARAVPRVDDTAFLVASGRNDTREPILPGHAAFFRDGALVGEDMTTMIPAGAEMELAFGPLDHLRLVWIDRTLAEGDRGVFTTSNTQDRAIAFGVENTSGSAEEVRLIYATPFAEQEDLDIDVTLAPAPDARDIDDRRGIHAWNLTVAPGETQLIEMGVTLEWPEGQVLTWWP